MPASGNRTTRDDRSANHLLRMHKSPKASACPGRSANEKQRLAETRPDGREKMRAKGCSPGASRKGFRLRDLRSRTPDQASPRVVFRRPISAQPRRTEPDSFFPIRSAVPESSNESEPALQLPLAESALSQSRRRPPQMLLVSGKARRRP